MNIKQALEYGIELLKENNVDEPILKTRILLSNILEQSKEYLIVYNNEEISQEAENKFYNYLNRLAKNEPIQYITNKQEFMGLEFYVDENVLIPQPDTEILVEETIKICKNFNIEKANENNVGVDAHIDPLDNIKILDLCTGSGAIGISIARNIKNYEIILSDISGEALEIATRNSKTLVGETIGRPQNNEKEYKRCEIKIIQSDLFENINDKFDIIVSNPPYIKTEVIKTLDKEVQKEPILALDGGEDGLDIYRRIIEQGYKYLNENGYLCLEIGYDQKEEVIELIGKTNKYTSIYSKKDLAGNDRIVICKNCQKSIE